MKKLLLFFLFLPCLLNAQVLTQNGKVLTQGGKPITRGGDIGTLTGLKIWHAAWKETATADGTAKATLVDYSNNGIIAAQATGANQPLFKTGILNGKPAYLFDGTNDGMTYANLATFQNQGAVTIYIVYKKVSGTGNMSMFISTTPSGTGRISYYLTGGTGTQMASRRLDAEAATVITGGVTDNNAHVVAMVFNYTSGQSRFFQDQNLVNVATMVSSGSTTNTASTFQGLGFNAATSADYFNGYIAEFVVCQAVHPDAMVYNTMQQLKARYGL